MGIIENVADSAKMYKADLTVHPEFTLIGAPDFPLDWAWYKTGTATTGPYTLQDASIGRSIRISITDGWLINTHCKNFPMSDSIIQARCATGGIFALDTRLTQWHTGIHGGYNGFPIDGYVMFLDDTAGTVKLTKPNLISPATQLASSSLPVGFDKSDFTVDFRAIGDTLSLKINNEPMWEYEDTGTTRTWGYLGMYAGANNMRLAEINMYDPNVRAII